MSEFGSAELKLLQNALEAVGKAIVLPAFHDLSSVSVHTKSNENDLVTDADLAAEKALVEKLQNNFPHAFYLGEEMVAKHPALLDRLADEEFAIIIDPIDGTWNFAHGLPLFGMMLAVTCKGKTIAGVIHYPLAGDTIWAIRGSGAFHTTSAGTNHKLQVAAPRELENMMGLFGLSMFPQKDQAELAKRATRFQRTTNLRCSAYEYRLIAQGGMHFSMNGYLNPWDHAAGCLIHEEAGGHSALLDGRTYDVSIREGRLLLAPDVTSWDEIAKVFLLTQ